MADQRGFSILEICTVVFILCFVMCVAIPSFTQFLMRAERSMVLERLEAAIQYAKQEAFVRGKTITVCGSINHQTCQKDDWSAGFIILEQNGQVSQFSQKIIAIFPKLRYGKLSFSEFGTHLNISPDGTTINNGTFTYCPKNGNRKEADALIINHCARTYRPTQRNSLGILLKNAGTPEEESLSCF